MTCTGASPCILIRLSVGILPVLFWLLHWLDWSLCHSWCTYISSPFPLNSTGLSFILDLFGLWNFLLFLLLFGLLGAWKSSPPFCFSFLREKTSVYGKILGVLQKAHKLQDQTSLLAWTFPVFAFFRRSSYSRVVHPLLPFLQMHKEKLSYLPLGCTGRNGSYFCTSGCFDLDLTRHTINRPIFGSSTNVKGIRNIDLTSF